MQVEFNQCVFTSLTPNLNTSVVFERAHHSAGSNKKAIVGEELGFRNEARNVFRVLDIYQNW